MPQKKQKTRNIKENKLQLKQNSKIPKKKFPSYEDLYGEITFKK